MSGLLPENVATLAIDFSYLLVAFLFIMGLKAMSSPVTARRGIVVAGFGMLIGTLMSFLYPGMGNFPLMLAAIAIGGGLAWWSGRIVAMTDMPQMIALYNGMGGGAAAAIAAVELLRMASADPAAGATHGPVVTALAAAGAFIGAVSFSGSLIAFGKLQGLIKRSFRFKGQQIVNLVDRRGDARARRLHRDRGPSDDADRGAVLRAGAPARHHDDAADRRRRHAGGDLALQRVHRPRGRIRGLRARERGHDHRRHRRGLAPARC